MATPIPELPHVTKRNSLSGNVTVLYQCPACSAELKSPVNHAGISERCPDCNHRFMVPGISAKEAETARLALEAERAHAPNAKEVARRERAAKARSDATVRRRAAKARWQESIAVQNSRPQTHWCQRDGWLLQLIGGVLLLVAFTMDTTVNTDLRNVGSEAMSYAGSYRVHNIGLLNTRLGLIVCGTAAAIAGWVLRAVGALGAQIDHEDKLRLTVRGRDD